MEYRDNDFKIITRAFQHEGKLYDVSIAPDVIILDGVVTSKETFIVLIADPDRGTYTFNLQLIAGADFEPIGEVTNDWSIEHCMALKVGEIIDSYYT